MYKLCPPCLHETNTHNHCCKTMDDLPEQAEHFMDNAAPFPNGGHGLQRV
jgi:hypothetical protein